MAKSKAATKEEASAMNKHQKLIDDGEGDHHLNPEDYARSYQLEALERAMKQNTIVYLETGTGKTLIAVMLLRAYAHKIRKPNDSIAVFLVPTVVLIDQATSKGHRDEHGFEGGQVYGDMGVDFWSLSTWQEKLQQHEVFVMTPQILLNNLKHSFFKMEKIKLLIFDECHHARGKHPYACIMTEFYHCQLKSNSIDLPRIFGMTASLIKSKGLNSRSAYNNQITEFESLMNSKVYTVDSEAVLVQYVPFATPKIKLYNYIAMPSDLYVCLSDHLDKLKMEHLKILREKMLDDSARESAGNKIKKLYATLQFCLTELGVWSAIKAAEALSCKENDVFFWGERKDGVGETIVREFSQEVFQFFSKYLPSDRCIGDDLKADTLGGYLSSKVHCLIKSLLDYSVVQNLRCIVFVERIITAMVLRSILCEIKQLSWLGAQYMAGNRCFLTQSRNEQMRIVDAFHEGKARIIVATNILEEGLDVQSCNLVIRFDPSATVCSFIQSRGRARMQGSDYLLIVKSDDSLTLGKVANYLNSGRFMREESLKQGSIPCKPLKNEMYDEEFYCVETTGAKVTLSSSVSLIYFYCSRLPSDGFFKPAPRFIIDKESNTCTLHLPKSCPIQTVVVEGRSGISVKLLKQIACLEATKKLHHIGVLSDLLLPIFDIEIEDDAQDSVYESYNDEQVDYYPEELVNSWSAFSHLGLYYCYKISLDQDVTSDVTFSDIILAVKTDLGADSLPHSFRLEANGGSVTVRLKYVGRVHLSREQVLTARRFQTVILNLLIQNNIVEYKNAVDGLSTEQSSIDVAYLLLPSIGGSVDWDSIESVGFPFDKLKSWRHKRHFRSCGVAGRMHTIDGAACRCMLQNSVVYTPHTGKFYCINGILDTMTGNSILKLKEGEHLSYKEYFKARHGVDLKWENEPLLAGRHLFTVHNFLARQNFRKEKESRNAFVELPPELCKIISSPISINILYTYSFLPTIMHRVECLLLASKLKTIHSDHCMQSGQVPVSKILEAITTKKCLEEFSLESLETLGDSFLKYATSQHVFKSHAHHHQGILTAKREKLISNASLCRLGCIRNLTGFIRTEQFDPKQWIIPGDYLNSSKKKKTLISSQNDIYIRGTRRIKGKVIADSVEALLGAYLSAGGECTAILFLKSLGMGIDFHEEMAVERPVLENPYTFVNIKDLEILLKYKFIDPSLLVEALTHGSFQLPDIPGCYQRLEFLGDAVLDYLITVHLNNKYPGLTPGLMTDLRSASVNNDCYAHAAVKAGLNKHILHASSELHRQMTFYLNNFTKSFSGSSHGWEAGAALPKVLGDVIESIAGAIYIDSKFNKELVWNSIRPLLEPMVTPETMERHPVRELQELCSQKHYTLSFSKISEGGVASITAEVEANGVCYTAKSTGTNKLTAKKLAAKDLLCTLKTAISGE